MLDTIVVGRGVEALAIGEGRERVKLIFMPSNRFRMNTYKPFTTSIQ
jgi:hypothetical protein